MRLEQNGDIKRKICYEDGAVTIGRLRHSSAEHLRDLANTSGIYICY